MKSFNLAQALKHKNRLAGEIARAREIVQRENSRKESQAARADVHAVFDQCVAQSRELAAFKGAIAAANAGVCRVTAASTASSTSRLSCAASSRS